MKHIVIGARVEKYFGAVTEGHNCDFKEVPTELERVTVLTVKGGYKYKTVLETSYGECSSGWTTASWGQGSMSQVDNFECGFTHVPKEFMEVEDTMENNFFGHSGDGGDDYYPSGGHYFNEEFFVPTGRQAEKPITFIFIGKSAVGKSFLASKLNDLEVFETDTEATLNIPLTADVVVLGNKYDYTVEDVVKSFEGKRKCRIVRFE